MRALAVSVDGETFQLALDRQCGNPAAYKVNVNGQEVQVVVPVDCDHLEDIDWLIVDGHPYEITFDHQLRWLDGDHGQRKIQVRDLQSGRPPVLSLDGIARAPIPGLIAQVLVADGQSVEIGQPLMILEAMKMQNEIRAPRSGKVECVFVHAGQRVGMNDPLVEIA
jgi:acetyl/propionyl-CoA carboxylase alpha subunit